MNISHSVMEGQRHNNPPLTRIVFVYNGPKGMELASNPHYSMSIQRRQRIRPSGNPPHGSGIQNLIYLSQFHMLLVQKMSSQSIDNFSY